MGITTSQICAAMHDLEDRHALLDWKIEGVYIWPVLRMTLYYDLTVKTGLYQENIAEHEGRTGRLGNVLRSLLCNPFWLSGRKKYALYVHNRKVQGRDIYSDQVMREMGDEALVLDSSFASGQCLPHGFDMGGFTALAVLYRRFKKKLGALSNRADLKKIKLLETEIKTSLKADVNLKPLIMRKLYLFKFLKPVYKMLFRMKGVRHLYIVNAYSYPYIVAAAQELGIKVNELQHGLITPYHMGYSYPGREIVPYFPDKFLCFGEYWPQVVAMPARTHTRVIGAPHIAALLNKNVPKKERSIFFSSQTVIGEEVFDYAVKTARLLPDYTVTLNLHPHDTMVRYDLSGLPENLSVVHKPSGFFELLAGHEIQAGSFSTTLFEGMVLGNKIILLDLPGAENMEPVLKRGDAIFVRSPEELAEKIGIAKPAQNTADYYAQPAARILAGDLS